MCTFREDKENCEYEQTSKKTKESYIRHLPRAMPRQKHQLLKTAPDSVIKFLVERTRNILLGNAPLTSNQFAKLKKSALLR